METSLLVMKNPNDGSDSNCDQGRTVLSWGGVCGLTAILFATWSGTALATISQGDMSIYGNFRTQWAGRWGEGGDRGGTSPTTTFGPTGTVNYPASRTGGSFDFNHWDLVEAKMVADVRPDYHLVKNYSFLGRGDTVFIKDADFFAVYRGWYDAFGDFKNRGIAQPFNDWEKWTQREKDELFKRNDLREYYAQVNVSDDLSFRIGKQQIIWSEADALSGTEVLNPPDLRFHWTHFESPEDQRRNVRIVNMNYIIGDLWKTANNEFEAFWIPGDFQGAGPLLNTTDKRQPYIAQVAEAPFNPYLRSYLGNQEGQITRQGNLSDGAEDPVVFVNLGSPSSKTPILLLDLGARVRQKTPSNSINNSEFGARYSTLLPLGNGLQVSFIYENLFRAAQVGVDPLGPPPPCVSAGTCLVLVGPDQPVAQLNTGGGVWLTINTSAPNAYYRTRAGGLPMASTCSADVMGLGPVLGALGLPAIGGVPLGFGVPAQRCGQLTLDLLVDIVRSSFFGVTGTYYDKDLTDMVFRYDLAYLPKSGVFGNGMITATPDGPAKSATIAQGKDSGAWTDKFQGIVACDRPTFIPWLSKQHTFLVAQQVTSWFPSASNHPLLSVVSTGGKFRHYQNLGVIAAMNWLVDGRWVSTNVFAWDEDDNTGFLSSTNVFRYSRNILFNFNVQWYLGRSGRYTDPVAFSRDQRINETELRLTYEI
jgi:hypothetical protein